MKKLFLITAFCPLILACTPKAKEDNSAQTENTAQHFVLPADSKWLGEYELLVSLGKLYDVTEIKASYALTVTRDSVMFIGNGHKMYFEHQCAMNEQDGKLFILYAKTVAGSSWTEQVGDTIAVITQKGDSYYLQSALVPNSPDSKNAKHLLTKKKPTAAVTAKTDPDNTVHYTLVGFIDDDNCLDSLYITVQSFRKQEDGNDECTEQEDRATLKIVIGNTGKVYQIADQETFDYPYSGYSSLSYQLDNKKPGTIIRKSYSSRHSDKIYINSYYQYAPQYDNWFCTKKEISTEVGGEGDSNEETFAPNTTPLGEKLQ